MYNPDRFEWYLTYAGQATCLDIRDFLGSALVVEAGAWALHVADAIEHDPTRQGHEGFNELKPHWERLMKAAFVHGADLHFVGNDKYTLLGDIIQRFHPFDAEHIIREWLQFLKSSGIDTYQYMVTERGVLQHLSEPWHWAFNILRPKRAEITFDPLQNPITDVFRSIDPTGHAAMVLDEFAGLGDDESSSPLDLDLATNSTDWQSLWPFSPRKRKKIQSQCDDVFWLGTERSHSDSDELTAAIPGTWIE